MKKLIVLALLVVGFTFFSHNPVFASESDYPSQGEVGFFGKYEPNRSQEESSNNENSSSKGQTKEESAKNNTTSVKSSRIGKNGFIPQLGEQKTLLFTLIGLLIVLISVLIILFKRKNKQKEEGI